jgi:hypothetical protein
LGLAALWHGLIVIMPEDGRKSWGRPHLGSHCFSCLVVGRLDFFLWCIVCNDEPHGYSILLFGLFLTWSNWKLWEEAKYVRLPRTNRPNKEGCCRYLCSSLVPAQTRRTNDITVSDHLKEKSHGQDSAS